MKDTYWLSLTGVDSEHCAFIVAKSLDGIGGISAHKVEWNNQRVQLQTDHPQAVLPEAVVAIRGLGYGVDTVKRTFPVTGMSCASCAISAESILRSQPGVLHATVNFAGSTVWVEYIPGIVSPGSLRDAIRSVGYDLVVTEETGAADRLEALQEAQSRSLRRRAWFAILLSVPLVLIGMFLMRMPYANYIMWALSTPVVLVAGRQFFIHAWKQARHRSANMDTLVAMSTGIAYVFSVFNTVYPEFWQRRGLHAHVYFEAAAVVIAFILLGKLLEERAKRNTSSAIKKLMGLQPLTVTVVYPGGREAKIPAAEVKAGDILRVKPGERIAVDGILTEGSSYVDESMISGEPVPVLKQVAAKVFSGTINQKGSFSFRAGQVGADTLLARIIKAVEEAQGSKAPVQQLVDKIAGIFVPAVLGIALLTLVLWTWLGGPEGFTHGLMAMVTVLVIACPCALGLATPTAIMVGVGKGAEQGILIKDAESLELACKTDAIVLDKTGTLTEGKPELTGIVWQPGVEAENLAAVLYALESSSGHPLADAVTRYLQQQGVTPVKLSQFESITGKGISGTWEQQQYHIGSSRYMSELGIPIPAVLQQQAACWRAEAQTVVWFAAEQEALAVIAIGDQIKTGAAATVQRLKEMGIIPYMLTGDNPDTAAAIAKQAGIAQFKAEVLPADKAAFIQQLQRQGHTVAMVGDGINDGPALAQADVSIAMGGGTDIAMGVARMTLVSSDLAAIPRAVTLSRKTVRVIRQNLFWAFIYNVIGIPLAAGVLYPVNGFLLDPMIAGAAMALSSVSVVANSLRLKHGGL